MRAGIFVALLFLSTMVFAGEGDGQQPGIFHRPNRENRTQGFYFFWGYNRASFTKSNIHVHGPEYEFTVYNVVAHDRPTPVTDEAYYNPKFLTIPQFNFRFGYVINTKWAVSVGWDHMKYVMDDGQIAELSGYINHPTNTKYNGSYLREPMKLTPDLFKFEHTDGLNVASVDVERTFPLWSSKRQLFSLHSVNGAGTGVVIPRTDVRVVGVGLNNHWNVAGYHLNAKTAIRFEFLRNGFFQLESRAGYVNLPNVLIQNDKEHRIDHHFFFLEGYAVIGMFLKVNK